MLKYVMIGTMVLLTLAGCGEENSLMTTNNKSSEEVSGGSSGIVAGSLEPTLTLQDIQHDTATFLYRLQNQTEQVQTIHFPSSQKYDYVLSDDKGEALKTYSANKSFVKEKENVELKQAEVLEYTIMIEDLAPGNYTLEMWLATDEQYKQTIEFSIK
ncbi:BsuPI-related putative proteinase inhibitor [Guptibacillus hwajinpoensis]|uniref:BsuPI-related putative proteinase inhibitor n=1 Tax=Guptibacillus hwajinpoensis TaxID=208199 RepID=UPI001CFE8B6C|nr:BsuPI-related putative proteinase inhibitor [Pseudalkalibacillus hwajinpoensis]